MPLDADTPTPELAAIGRAGRTRALVVAAAATATLALALLKPWAGSAPGASPLPSPSPVESAQASEMPFVYFRQCYPYNGWRLSAVQETGGKEVRTVWPVAARFEPTLSDTEGPRLVGNVTGIGYCAPGQDPEKLLADASVSLWRVAETGALTPVDGAHVMDARLLQEGEVYLAPPASLAGDGVWPAGDYFFAVRSSRRLGASTTWLPLRLLPATTHDVPSPCPSQEGPFPLTPSAEGQQLPQQVHASSALAMAYRARRASPVTTQAPCSEGTIQ